FLLCTDSIFSAGCKHCPITLYSFLCCTATADSWTSIVDHAEHIASNCAVSRTCGELLNITSSARCSSAATCTNTNCTDFFYTDCFQHFVQSADNTVYNGFHFTSHASAE